MMRKTYLNEGIYLTRPNHPGGVIDDIDMDYIRDKVKKIDSINTRINELHDIINTQTYESTTMASAEINRLKGLEANYNEKLNDLNNEYISACMRAKFGAEYKDEMKRAMDMIPEINKLQDDINDLHKQMSHIELLRQSNVRVKCAAEIEEAQDLFQLRDSVSKEIQDDVDTYSEYVHALVYMNKEKTPVYAKAYLKMAKQISDEEDLYLIQKMNWYFGKDTYIRKANSYLERESVRRRTMAATRARESHYDADLFMYTGALDPFSRLSSDELYLSHITNEIFKNGSINLFD